MSRWSLLLVGLATAAAFAASADLRLAAGAATETRFDDFYADMVEALPPQQRAEQALQMAINRRAGAAEYITKNAQSWRGRIVSNETLKVLLMMAGDASLIEVRMAAFEIYLAQSNLEKSSAEVDRLLQRRLDDPQGASAWVLWNIAVLGARGVERERVFHELLLALRSVDLDLRRWAVDAMAKFGGVEIISPLLDIAAHEPSVVVRERAFCALAQSATLHVAERYEAVPGLLGIAADAKADRQSVAWAFQALREITGSRDLADDANVWREHLQRAGLL